MPRKPRAPKDGALVLDGLLTRARARRTAIAWDIDGTLFDTRHRMLETVRAFGVARARFIDVDWTWEETARRLQLPRDAFRAFWDAHFWHEDSFDHDRPIAETLSRMRRAQRLGVDNYALTGRTHHRHETTWAQLERHGVTPRGVVSKPEVGEPTPAYKAAACVELIEQGAPLRAFVTDSQAEIVAVRAVLPALVCVLCVDDVAVRAAHAAQVVDDVDDVAVLRWRSR